jgi:alkaline phosphatase
MRGAHIFYQGYFSSRITHATPAATYSYSFDRNLECDTKVPEHLKSKFKDIAIQLVEDAPGKNLNVIMGGGRQYLGATKAVNYTRIQFPGNTEIPCTRTDNRNLVEHWLKSKTNTAYVTNTKELLSVDTDKTDHLMGLFADNHMIYDIARNKDPEGEPSLTQMTKAAIKILNNKNNDNGFVLMVESGRIDMAHHQNLGRAALHDFVEFERAIEMAVEALKGTDTLIIVTADHSHAFQFNGYGNRGNDIFGEF